MASTASHILWDIDRGTKLFGLRQDDFLNTGVGPNVRKLITCLRTVNFMIINTAETMNFISTKSPRLPRSRKCSCRKDLKDAFAVV